MAAPVHPLFARSIGAGARLAVWTAVSILIIVLDARFNSLLMLRNGLASLLRPLQTVVRLPVDVAVEVSGFLVRHRAMQVDNASLRALHVRDAAELHQMADLQAENAQLRGLLDARAKSKIRTVAAEIWTVARDPFSRRAVLNKGTRAGIAPGQPVVDAQGLVGQIARAYPFSSDLIMVTDPDQAVPAYVQRTGRRVLVFGTGYGLEVRYQPSVADIRRGDVLLTSGIDHVYPEGLPLARVNQVVRPSSDPYAKVYCLPIANVEGSRMLMVLLTKPVGARMP
ncbi:MAG TPA: rod shape-determining protein MreC [Thiobacillaceae bacterium]|nr:rod shape-determining protein MreC [Thiobacillaceae bacterium]